MLPIIIIFNVMLSSINRTLFNMTVLLKVSKVNMFLTTLLYDWLSLILVVYLWTPMRVAHRFAHSPEKAQLTRDVLFRRRFLCGTETGLGCCLCQKRKRNNPRHRSKLELMKYLFTYLSLSYVHQKHYWYKNEEIGISIFCFIALQC